MFRINPYSYRDDLTCLRRPERRRRIFVKKKSGREMFSESKRFCNIMLIYSRLQFHTVARAYHFSFATSLITLSNDFAPGASPDNCQIIIPEASFFAKRVFLLMVGMPL